MIGQLPYIGQSGNVYGPDDSAPSYNNGYQTLSGLAGGLLGAAGAPAAPYGYGGQPSYSPQQYAQQTGAVSAYLQGPPTQYAPPPPQPNYASYAQRPPTTAGYGWSDARSSITAYPPSNQPQAYMGSYQSAYPAQRPLAQYPPQQPQGYGYGSQLQGYQAGGNYNYGGSYSGMFYSPTYGGTGNPGFGVSTPTGFAPAGYGAPPPRPYAPPPGYGGPPLTVPPTPVSIGTFGPSGPTPEPLPAQPVKPTGGFEEISSTIATRLIGTKDNRDAISFGGNNPRDNSDGRVLERLAVWDIMKLDDSLLYDADRKMLVRPFANGTRADVAHIDHFTPVQFEHLNEPGLAQLGTTALLGRLPAPETLLGSQPPQGKPTYPRVGELTDNPQSWKEGSPLVKERLVGNATVQSTIHFNGQDPRINDDFKGERMTVWNAFQSTSDMRYNVDTQTFFVTRPDGSTSNVATLAQTQAAQAAGTPLENFFLTASTQPSFGSQFPANSPFGSPNQTSAIGATLVSDPFADPQPFGGLPPFGSFGTTPNPGAATTAFGQFQNSDPFNMPIEDFLNGIGAIRQATGGRAVAPVNGPGQKGPFTVVAHRYFDHTTQQYVPVADVLIAEKGNFSDRTRNYNPAQFSDFEATKPDAQVGKYYQVTVTWGDGKQKVWDYRMDQANGTRVDMWSPVA